MKRKYSLFHSLVLTLLMSLPLVVGIAFLAGFIYESWSEYKRFRQMGSPAGWHSYSELKVLPDGTPVIHEQIRRDNYLENKLTTLDGRELARDQKVLFRINLQSYSDGDRVRRQFHNRLFEPTEVLKRPSPARFENRDRVWLFRESSRGAEAYYLVQTDRELQRVFGYLDRQGPRADEPSPESCFGLPMGLIESGSRIVFQSGPEIVAVDFENPSVVQISDEVALDWGFRQRNPDAAHGPELFLSTGDTIRTVDFQGRPLEAYQMEGRVTDLYLTEDDRLLAKTFENSTQTLWELGDDGQVRQLAEFEVKLGRAAPPAGSQVGQSVDWFIGQTGLGIMFPGPGVLLGVETAMAGIVAQTDDSESGFAGAWRKVHDEFPWAIPMSAVFGAIAAIFCYRRQRSYQAAWTKTWTVFVFLFGPAGYLAWRWHRDWPPLEIVGVTDATFEEPAPNGLEVFA